MISNPYKKAASVLGFSQSSLRRWENEYHLNCFMDTDGSQHVIPKRLPQWTLLCIRNIILCKSVKNPYSIFEGIRTPLSRITSS